MDTSHLSRKRNRNPIFIAHCVQMNAGILLPLMLCCFYNDHGNCMSAIFFLLLLFFSFSLFFLFLLYLMSRLIIPCRCHCCYCCFRMIYYLVEPLDMCLVTFFFSISDCGYGVFDRSNLKSFYFQIENSF